MLNFIIPMLNKVVIYGYCKELEIDFNNFFLLLSCYYVLQTTEIYNCLLKQCYDYLELHCETHIYPCTIENYVKFMLPFCLGYKAVLLFNLDKDKQNININTFINQFYESESIQLFDIWSIAHFTSGAFIKPFCTTMEDALLVHLAFELFEYSSIFSRIGENLPLIIKKQLQFDTYHGDTLENVCGDFISFYFGYIIATRI